MKLLRKLSELTPEQTNELYMRVFNSDDGQLVLEDLRQRCFYYVPTIDQSQLKTGFNEGSRSVVLNIEARLRAEKPTKED